jgi:hypothetical protein
LAEFQLALVWTRLRNGGRSSTVEPRIVVPAVAGSNPVGHPTRLLVYRLADSGDVAASQLAVFKARAKRPYLDRGSPNALV